MADMEQAHGETGKHHDDRQPDREVERYFGHGGHSILRHFGLPEHRDCNAAPVKSPSQSRMGAGLTAAGQRACWTSLVRGFRNTVAYSKDSAPSRSRLRSGRQQALFRYVGELLKRCT